MRRMRTFLRLGVTASCLSAVGPAAAGDGSPYGTVLNAVDPPGWFGPGPNWHKWREPGPGAGWSYYKIPDGPTPTYPFTPEHRHTAAGDFRYVGSGCYGDPMALYAPYPGWTDPAIRDHWHRSHPRPVNAAFPGLGWAGYRNPSPRPVNPTVGSWPDVPGAFPMPATPPADPTCIRVGVRVPDKNAVVAFNKAETKQTGTDRVYESPALKAGEKYRYELVAKWTDNGQPRSETRTVTATAGESVVVDFTRPEVVQASAQK